MKSGSPIVTTGPGGGPAVQVDALNPNPPNFLAQSLFNVSPKTHASATAAIVAPGSEAGVVPVSVNIVAASQWQSGQLLHLFFDGDTSENGFIAGNYCGNGENQLGDCITNGVTNPVSVGSTVQAIPGSRWHNGPHVQNAWDARLGDTVLPPVYQSNPDGSCPSSGCTVVGFATFVIGPSLANDDIQVTFEGNLIGPSGGTPGQFYGTGSVAIVQ